MPRSFLLLVCALLAVSACSSDKSQTYHHKFDRFDKYSMAKVAIESTPPGAQVFAKARYEIKADLRGGSRRRSTDWQEEGVKHELEDWTLIGTTPIADHPVLLTGTAKSRQLTSSATMHFQLREFSLRIEKAGHETLEIPRVAFQQKDPTFRFELVPVDE